MIVAQRRELYQEVITMEGEDSRFDKVVEECAELIDKIQKFKRGRATEEEVKLEIADVMITAEMLSLTLCDDFHTIKPYTELRSKLMRLKRSVEKGELR